MATSQVDNTISNHHNQISKTLHVLDALKFFFNFNIAFLRPGDFAWLCSSGSAASWLGGSGKPGEPFNWNCLKNICDWKFLLAVNCVQSPKRQRSPCYVLKLAARFLTNFDCFPCRVTKEVKVVLVNCEQVSWWWNNQEQHMASLNMSTTATIPTILPMATFPMEWLWAPKRSPMETSQTEHTGSS